MPEKLRKDPASRDADDSVDLLARYRDGDRKAFDGLVLAYQERLVHFFYRLCWDVGRSEDLTQNLFLKLLHGARRYRPEGKLSTFIFRVATNLWIDHYRAQRPRQRLYSLDQALMSGHQPLEAVTRETPADLAEDGEDRRRMRSGLEKLTEPHRLVFELAVYQELPYAQISEVLEIPVGTVKSRMHNAVKALKNLMAERSDAGGGRGATFRIARGVGGAG